MSMLLALLPVLIPLFGAPVAYLARRYPRSKPFVVVAFILLTFAFLVVNTLQSNNPGFLIGQESLVPDIDLRFNYNPVTLLFSSLGLGACLAWLLIENLRAATRFGSASLVMLAGVVALVCADNWATLLAGWLLADLGLLAWRMEMRADVESRELAWRAFGLSLFGAVGAAAGAFALLASNSSLRLDDSALADWAGTFILIAAWLRSGFFPFHIAIAEHLSRTPGPVKPAGSSLPAKSRGGHGLHPSVVIPSPRARIATDDLYGVAFSILMGLYLFVRSQLATTGEFAFGGLIFLLALLALGATTLLTLFSEEGDIQQLWAVLAVGASLWLIPFAGELTVHPALAVWGALGLWHFVVLLIGLRLLRAHSARQPWRQVLIVAAILCGGGFPLTPGFLGRIGLYAALLQDGALAILLLLPAALTLALIPLWRAFMNVSVREERTPTLVEYLGIALLAVPPLVEGLLPFAVMSLFGRNVEDASAFAYDALVHAPNPLQPLMLVLAVLIPFPLAWFLAHRSAAWRERVATLPRAIPTALSLSTVSRAAVRVLDAGGILLRYASTLIEQHPVGWFLFAALWLALWLVGLR